MAIRWIVNGVLVVALAVVFAGWGTPAAERISEEQAIAEIQKLGGKVTLDEKSPGRPVIAVDFRGKKIVDAGPEHEKRLAHFLAPNAVKSRATDAGLEYLKRLTQLQTLDLAYTQVTDAGLAHLKDLTQLRTLDLFGTQITDAGLEHLQAMTQLQTLVLWGREVTDIRLAVV